MYKIIKVLNNNTILACNETEEVIIMYKVIGFSKKVDDYFEVPRNAKKFLMQKGYKAKSGSNDIINYIDPVYLEIASEIIRLIIEKFGKIDNDILLPLADHIYFAIKRMDENIMPLNPFIDTGIFPLLAVITIKFNNIPIKNNFIYFFSMFKSIVIIINK